MPARRDDSIVRPDLWGAIITRCLDKEPGRRCQKADEVCAALSTIPPHAPGVHLIAVAHLALGDKEAAFEELEAGYKAHLSGYPWIRVHGGDLDSVRDDPRFQDLLKRMNLPR